MIEQWEQLSFFAEAGQSKHLPGLIDGGTSERLLAKFIGNTPWKQTTQKSMSEIVHAPGFEHPSLYYPVSNRNRQCAE
ncbi:MAG: Alkylated repair dioxygenase AlkB [Mucilaginibacter sp.]|nr:Alkylated repair dioxygenase AlkB [Mucilaginibacter sp.]